MSRKTTTTTTKEDAKPALVPKLRFPEFRGAEGWQVHPLSEFIQSLDAGVSVNSGDRPALKGEVGVLKTSSITYGVFAAKENKLVSDKIEIQRLKEPVRGNTIIISRMNTPDLVGANAYLEDSIDNLFLPDRLWAAKPKSSASMRFLSYILGSPNGREALRKLAKGSSGSMKNITKPDVLGLLFMIPLLPEQQKIAECLSSLDKLIAAQARKVDALKTHKKGLMQQLFPREGETQPHLRFPEFQNAGEWDAHPFEEFVAKSFYGTSSSTSPTGQYPVLRMGNMADGGLDITNLVYIDMDSDSFESFRLEDGDILLNRTNSPALVGKISIFRLKLECITASYIVTYRLNKKRIDPLFCNFMLNTPLHQAKIKALAKPSISQANINPTTFKKELIVAVPALPEQQRIASCLSNIDALVTAETKKLEALKAHKKGLMQQLFPAFSEA